MDLERLLAELSELPPAAQQQVMDYIVFVREQYAQSVPDQGKNGAALRDDPFFGMWRDRPDMEDSTEWVRKVRRSEWRLNG
jgi:hypothetical protein